MNSLFWSIIFCVVYGIVVLYLSSWFISDSIYETVTYNYLQGNRSIEWLLRLVGNVERVDYIQKHPSFVETDYLSKTTLPSSELKVAQSPPIPLFPNSSLRGMISSPVPPKIFNCTYCLPNFGQGDKNSIYFFLIIIW